MRRHAKAVSAGSNRDTDIRRAALFSRYFAGRDASTGSNGRGAPSYAHALPRAINRPLAIGGMLLALVFALALAASPARASYVNTGSWDPTTDYGNTYGLAVDPSSGSVYTTADAGGSGNHLTGLVKKWTDTGLPGTPDFFAQNFAVNFAGMAVSPTNGNLYVLADYFAATGIGDTHNGTPTIDNLVVNSGTFAAGQYIQATGIPSGTTIDSCTPNCTSPTSLTLDKNATADGSGVDLQAGTSIGGNYPNGAPGVQIFQPDGTPVGSPIPVSTGVDNGFGQIVGQKVGIDVDPSGNYFYVPNPSAGTVIKYNNSGNVFGTFGPNPGGTPLNDISGVAVDSSGNVYVSDRSSNRDNEVQGIDLHGASGGTYKLCFGKVNGNDACTGATFTGDTHAATGKGDVRLTTATADLHVLATGTGDTTRGSYKIENVSNAGDFAVGDSIYDGNRITNDATITAIDAGAHTITMSRAVSTGAPPGNLSISFISGSKIIDITNPGDFEVGMGVTAGNLSSSGIVVNKSTGVNSLNTTVTACDPACAAATGQGDVHNGTNLIDGVTTATGAFQVGQVISGAGIPGGTMITALDTPSTGDITLSANATADGSAVSLHAGAASLTLSRGVTKEATGVAIKGTSIDVTQTDSGAFEPGERFKASVFNFGFAYVEIMSNTAGVLSVNADASASATAVPITAGSPYVTNVDIQAGQFARKGHTGPNIGIADPYGHGNGQSASQNLAVSGPGIAAGAKTGFWYPGSKTLSLGTDLATSAGTGTFHADVTGLTVEDALEPLPTIGGDGPVSQLFLDDSAGLVFDQQGVPTHSVDINVNQQVEFVGPLGGRDLPAMTCQDIDLSGGSGGCEVHTGDEASPPSGVRNGTNVPGRVVEFDSAGNYLKDLVPPSGSYTADSVAVDKSSGDVFVAGGNGDWGNFNDVVGPDAPQFSVKRYDSSGSEQEEFGADVPLSAQNLTNGFWNLSPGPISALGVDSGHKLYVLGGESPSLAAVNGGTTVNVFSLTHKATVTIDLQSGISGSVSADSGDIQNCDSSGGANCSGDYVEGSTIVLTPTPAAHTEVDWTGAGCDSVDNNTNECTLTIPDHDVTLTPSSHLIPRTVTLTVGGNGAGTVDADSGDIQGCDSSGGVNCSGDYGESSQVVFTATPSGNSSVQGWTGGCTVSTTTVANDTCTLTVPDSSANVGVTLALNQRSLSIHQTGNGGGTVTCSTDSGSTFGACANSYDDGTELQVHVAPNSNSSFGGFDGSSGSANGCTGTADCSFTITQTTQVEVPLTLIPRSLSIHQTGNGGGTVTCKIDAGSFGACPSTLNSGQQVTVHVAPDSNSSFGGFDGSSGSANGCTGNADCSFPITADTQVEVPLTKIPRTLTINQTGSGGGTITCNGSPCTSPIDSGTSVTVHVAPDSNSSFGGFDNSTGSANGCTGTSDCVFNITASTIVNVPLNHIPRTLTLNTNLGSGSGTISCDSGSGDGPCAATYDSGTQLTVTAHAGNHAAFGANVFAGSTGSASACTSSSCTFTITADSTLKGTFDLILHTLSVTADGNGNGSVSADFADVNNCSKSGGTCSDNQVVDGTIVTLTATPTHSSVAWSGDCDLTNGATCTTTVDAAKNVTATFTLDKHSLIVAKTGAGSGAVKCDGGACASSYDHGTSVTLSASADSGSSFSGWSGACSGTGDCTIAIDADKSATANFTLNDTDGDGVPDNTDACPTQAGTGADGCPVVTPPNNNKAYGQCVKGANKAYHRALKAAKRKHGKARAKALKAAKKHKTKAIAKCKIRFHKRHHTRHGGR